MIWKIVGERLEQLGIAALFVSLPIFSNAQTVDPSSALLLNRANSDSSTRSRTSDPRSDSRLDSGRYTVRPRPETRTETRPETKSEARLAPTTRRTVEPAPTPGPVSEPVYVPIKSSTSNTSSNPSVNNEESSVLLPSTSDGVVVLSGTESSDSTDSTTPTVLSNRLLEVSIATAYLYENAESGYSFRQATMAGPAYTAAAKVWFSPEFAIGGSYFSSLGGQVADGASAVSASRTDTVYGIYLKKPFSTSALTFGIEFLETQFKISGDAVSKLNTKSNGLRVSIEGEFQSGPRSSWAVGFSASPKIQHEESPAATNAQSGTAVNAYQVGASIQRRWQFDSAHAIFFKLEHRLERDLFTGSASRADPIGGATPTGVAATVGTTVIQFGYNWGN